MLSSCRTVVALVGDSFHEAVEPEAVRTPERNLRDKIKLERNYIAQRARTKLLISLSAAAMPICSICLCGMNAQRLGKSMRDKSHFPQ
jgi:hypothetical protein